MAIEIVDFPIKTGWFSIAMLIYQRVMYMSYCVTHDMYIYIYGFGALSGPQGYYD